MKEKAVIVGGGIGGLTTAHEFVDRGFEVLRSQVDFSFSRLLADSTDHHAGDLPAPAGDPGPKAR